MFCCIRSSSPRVHCNFPIATSKNDETARGLSARCTDRENFVDIRARATCTFTYLYISYILTSLYVCVTHVIENIAWRSVITQLEECASASVGSKTPSSAWCTPYICIVVFSRLQCHNARARTIFLPSQEKSNCKEPRGVRTQTRDWLSVQKIRPVQL